MSEIVIFERCNGPQSYLFTFWPAGELRTFRDEAAARQWARNQALQPIFLDSSATKKSTMEEQITPPSHFYAQRPLGGVDTSQSNAYAVASYGSHRKMCLSCGAPTNAEGQLPCGH